MKRVWLVLSPMSQLNTPYPSTAYLAGFLRSKKYVVDQSDASIELYLRLMCPEGFDQIKMALGQKTPSVVFFLECFERYRSTIGPVICFLQGKDPSLAYRITTRKFLPEGPRFVAAQDAAHMEWAFGVLGLQDRARFLASLYLDDLADVLRDGIDSRFQLSKYGESLAASNPDFGTIYKSLNQPETLIEAELVRWVKTKVKELKPEVVGLSIPFPGNVYGAFKIAATLKKIQPRLPIILGGGFVNTELRSLTDPRVFEFFDYLTLDDGETPILQILEGLDKPNKKYLRTMVLGARGEVELKSDPSLKDVMQKDLPAPSFRGLPLEKYLSILELLNPMHRIWSDTRWNKVTLAHGCYWKKCSFCDVNLDYIGRYDPAKADQVIDRMLQIIQETGTTGFHFVDEAAPPVLLKQLSERLIERKVQVTWWGNIRFEKNFDLALCELMAEAGCVAVSGGLEVASDRLLEKMNKGVTVEQVARVTQNFSVAGIMVHAYLMYGFPTQTVQETVDSLERVRQLFEDGCIQSAFWHRFSATIHSPIAKDPKKFGITIRNPPKRDRFFAENDLGFEDPTGVDHDRLGVGLNRALYNYMQGTGLDQKVTKWFDFKVPKTLVADDLVRNAISSSAKSRR